MLERCFADGGRRFELVSRDEGRSDNSLPEQVFAVVERADRIGFPDTCCGYDGVSFLRKRSGVCRVPEDVEVDFSSVSLCLESVAFGGWFAFACENKGMYIEAVVQYFLRRVEKVVPFANENCCHQR